MSALKVQTAPGVWTVVGGVGVNGADGLMAAATNAETIAGVSVDKAVTPSSLAAAMPARDLRSFGTVDLTGATDTTATLNAALAAIYAAGGGELRLPAGTIRVDGQITLPNDAVAVPHQRPLRIVGAGALFAGQASPPLGGTIVDMRYAGTGAKIQTFGLGLLQLTGFTLTDKGTSTTPFLLTTNTTLHADGIAFSGNPTKIGPTCDQDAIILGGTTNALDGTPNAAFQGYGTIISRCYFDRIRRGVYGRVFANAVVVRDCTWWVTCGGDAAAAAIEFDGRSGEPDTGLYCVGNLIEGTSYVQAIKLQRADCNYFANSIYDAGAAFVSSYLFGDDANFNMVDDVWRADSKPLMVETGTAVGTNSVRTAHQSQVSIAAQPWRFTNVTPTEFANAPVLASYASASGAFLSQPNGDPSNSSVVFLAKRSATAAADPGTTVFQVQQNGVLTLGGLNAGSIVFQNQAGAQVGGFSNVGRTWAASGAGGGMVIDSGSGGSNVDVKGFRLRFIDFLGNRQIALAYTAPADASIANGELVVWFDPTVGASKLMLRGKNTAGTIVNGNIALT